MTAQAMMTELSLFSGYGGFSLALQLLLGRSNIKTIGWCEIDSYAQAILKARINDGQLDDAPIWPDIRSADFSGLRGLVDIVTAGFPCQPYSVAGRREGEDDARNLWPQTAAAIDAVRPSYIALENVPGLLQPVGGREPYVVTVLGDLAKLGYDAVWCVLGARDVGAPHRRDRWFCLGYAKVEQGGDYLAYAISQGLEVGQGIAGYDGCQRPPSERGGSLPLFPPTPGDRAGWARVLAEHPEPAPALGYTPKQRLEKQEPQSGQKSSQRFEGSRESIYETQSPIRGMADGTFNRVDRLKSLGNGIVPQQAAYAFQLLLRMEMQV